MDIQVTTHNTTHYPESCSQQVALDSLPHSLDFIGTATGKKMKHHKTAGAHLELSSHSDHSPRSKPKQQKKVKAQAAKAQEPEQKLLADLKSQIEHHRSQVVKYEKLQQHTMTLLQVHAGSKNRACHNLYMKLMNQQKEKKTKTLIALVDLQDIANQIRTRATASCCNTIMSKNSTEQEKELQSTLPMPYSCTTTSNNIDLHDIAQKIKSIVEHKPRVVLLRAIGSHENIVGDTSSSSESAASQEEEQQLVEIPQPPSAPIVRLRQVKVFSAAA